MAELDFLASFSGGSAFEKVQSPGSLYPSQLEFPIAIEGLESPWSGAFNNTFCRLPSIAVTRCLWDAFSFVPLSREFFLLTCDASSLVRRFLLVVATPNGLAASSESTLLLVATHLMLLGILLAGGSTGRVGGTSLKLSHELRVPNHVHVGVGTSSTAALLLLTRHGGTVAALLYDVAHVDVG